MDTVLNHAAGILLILPHQIRSSSALALIRIRKAMRAFRLLLCSFFDRQFPCWCSSLSFGWSWNNFFAICNLVNYFIFLFSRMKAAFCVFFFHTNLTRSLMTGVRTLATKRTASCHSVFYVSNVTKKTKHQNRLCRTDATPDLLGMHRRGGILFLTIQGGCLLLNELRVSAKKTTNKRGSITRDIMFEKGTTVNVGTSSNRQQLRAE